MSGWETNHFPKTLASWCSLRLIQVCSSLAAKTMRKARKGVRIRVRNAHLAGLRIGG